MNTQNILQVFCLRLSVLCLAVLIALSPVKVYAQTFEEMYGPELQSIPYAYRVRYANEYGKAWNEAAYDERSQFLYMVYQEELQESIENQNVEFQEAMLESQKQIERDAEKIAEQHKEMNKEIMKNDKKIQEEMKKHELQIKSMQQKQKILNMRYQQ